MNSITLKSSAKVNLTLDVIGIREDSYHNIESIFQSVGIYDIVTVSKSAHNDIKISSNIPDVPCDKSNIAYKAAKVFFETYGKNSGIDIYIEKHIPFQAGLGGGSSDGAAVLTALNILFDAGLSSDELINIGSKVSADTPFFINGGTAIVQGIGDIIKPIRYIPQVDMVIAKGSSGISTPTAYRQIDMLFEPKHPKIEKLIKSIDKGKFLNHCNLCGNLFEQITDIKDVNDIKSIMIESKALTAVMSGSGSAVFGIFKNKLHAESCAAKLKQLYPFSEYCKPTVKGIEILNID